MEWPAQSPDLNQIEHLWDTLKNEIRGLPQARNLDDLWDNIQKAWAKITPEMCENLVGSMNRRLQAVLKAGGSHTNY